MIAAAGGSTCKKCIGFEWYWIWMASAIFVSFADNAVFFAVNGKVSRVYVCLSVRERLGKGWNRGTDWDRPKVLKRGQS